MSSLIPDAILDDISIFDQSSPESLKARALSPQLHDHIGSTSDVQTLNAEYDYPTCKQRAISSRSSISSFPGSVIHTVPFTDTEDVRPSTPFRSQSYDRTLRASGPSYLSAFRNPSSVRALQLESEWADSDASSTKQNAYSKRSPRLGSRSPGSVHSSPSKRLSRPATPKLQSKLKKEFPLVLLHCSLLPPAATAYGPLVAEEILQAVLPEKYRKRWKTLQDKVVKNNEVKQRGVLIPHPREDYDLLEERLLESLELERPRIRRGHFLGGRKSGDSDSGFESSSQNGTDEASDSEEKGSHERCSDCGTAVSRKIVQDRHWEVKVFAANGLMKSGAWAAAWEEMEKVDVEVGIWMPEDVKAEVEERLKALQAMEEAERPVDPPLQHKTRNKKARNFTAKIRHDERMREIYGEPAADPTQEVVDDPPAESQPQQQSERPDPPEMTSTIPETMAVHLDLRQEDFISYMKRNARIISQDQRNLAIVILSMLVLLFGFQNTKIHGTVSAQDSTSAQNTTLQHTPLGTVATPSTFYMTEIVIATPTTTDIPGVSSPPDKVDLKGKQQVENGESYEVVETSSQVLEIDFEQEPTTSNQLLPTHHSSTLSSLTSAISEPLEPLLEGLPDSELEESAMVCRNMQYNALDWLSPVCSS